LSSGYYINLHVYQTVIRFAMVFSVAEIVPVTLGPSIAFLACRESRLQDHARCGHDDRE
jgi:hypothetical protein